MFNLRSSGFAELNIGYILYKMRLYEVNAALHFLAAL